MCVCVYMCVCVCVKYIRFRLIWFGLLCIYCISTIVSYFMQNSLDACILNKDFVDSIFKRTLAHFLCMQLNGFIQLNDQTVLFLTIQFNISHFFAHSVNVKPFCLTHRYRVER